MGDDDARAVLRGVEDLLAGRQPDPADLQVTMAEWARIDGCRCDPDTLHVDLTRTGNRAMLHSRGHVEGCIALNVWAGANGLN